MVVRRSRRSHGIAIIAAAAGTGCVVVNLQTDDIIPARSFSALAQALSAKARHGKAQPPGRAGGPAGQSAKAIGSSGEGLSSHSDVPASGAGANAFGSSGDQPPNLDYPPPAASLTWPRWLSLAAATYAALQGFRRKLFGGAEAVALDPALPWSVRWELIKSRKELRNKGREAPRAFRSMLKDSADTLEELPALLVTVAVLAGDALRQKSKRGPLALTPFRRLGEAQALLFTAGRLHYGMPAGDKGAMRLLGGDFLFAEGQWTMAELGSLPAIRRTATMIREVSDGTSAGGAAHKPQGSIGELGAETALQAAFLRAGTYFAMAASGAGWVCGASEEDIKALYRYGTDLGCALELAQYREDVLSQDCALWLARSAKETLKCFSDVQGSSAAIRGMLRLAHRVERSCVASLEKLVERAGGDSGLSYGDFMKLRKQFDEDVVRRPGDTDQVVAVGPGFQRDEVADRELRAIIDSGLRPVGVVRAPRMEWPKEGPKAALEGTMRLIGRELVQVNGLLDGKVLGKPAGTQIVAEAVQQLFSTSGKRLRPALVLLVARALGAPAEGLARVASLAASVEVLHCASLVHDDILDGADFRRGKPTAHVQLGEKAATLVGDFLFATASVLVAELGSMPVVLLISKVVADFGRGELAQSAVRFEAVDYSLEDYLLKSFYKTASLLAAACQAAAVLSGSSPSSKEACACYRFGAYIGLAFQVVDDVLDFTSTEEELGKPAMADLKEGNLSAPVLLAAQSAQGSHGGKALDPAARQELLDALERRLANEGDLSRVLELVDEAGGVDQAKALSRSFADLAIAELSALPDNEAREALRVFAEFVVVRTS